MIYNSFSQLLNEFFGRTSKALVFEDRNLPGGRGSLTYPEFASLIRSFMPDVSISGASVDFVRTNHSPEVLIRIFADVIAGVTVVLLDPLLPPLREQAVRKLLTPRLEETEKSGSGKYEAAQPGEHIQEGRLIFFTSGTTHSSRAVVLSAAALLHAAWRGQECLPIGQDDTLLSLLPLSHVFGFVCTMLWGLCYGATVALGRGTRHLMDDPKFFRPTVLPLVPALASAMTRFGCYNAELKTVLIGAAPLGNAELQAMKKKTEADIYTGYGLTEPASGVAITEDTDDPYALRVCPGVELKLGQDSEILLKTDSLLERHIELLPLPEHLPEHLTDVLRRPEDAPLLDDEGFFHTGDVGFFDKNGRIHISGRKKDVLVLPDGTKIFCPEYEEALSEALGTDELAVTLRRGRAVLLVQDKVRKEAAEAAVSDLNRKLPRSQQIAGILSVSVPLPRTLTGKLKRWMIEKAILKGDFEEWKQ